MLNVHHKPGKEGAIISFPATKEDPKAQTHSKAWKLNLTSRTWCLHSNTSSDNMCVFAGFAFTLVIGTPLGEEQLNLG